MTEKLTADERANALEYVWPAATRILQAYDAALARAEAAEAVRDTALQSHEDCEDELRAAESLLAEAAALLELVTRGKPLADGTAWYKAYADFLSAMSNSDSTGTLSLTLARVPSEKPLAQAAEPAAEQVDRIAMSHGAAEHEYRAAMRAEHPDTIALRECRAELERMRDLARRFHESLTAKYAKAERDSDVA